MNWKIKWKSWRRTIAGLLAGICLLTSTGATALVANAASDDSAVTAEAAEATPETATPETASLSEQAQAFIAAVNALDRESILAAVRRWAAASAAWRADPDNTELEAALNEAIEVSDAAAAPVYAAEDLYYAIPEDEQRGDEVQTAYTALAALVASMQLAMEDPTLPEDTGAPPDEEIYELLYGDLPDAPTGSYMGKYGLPVATGNTKIGLSLWEESLLTDESSGRMDAEALNADDLTVTVAVENGKDYAIVPIMVQVEYPANNSVTQVILPEDVTVMALDSRGALTTVDDPASVLNTAYVETSAAVSGFYVQAESNFTAELVYTAPDGTGLSKTLDVVIDRTPGNDMAVSTYEERPVPDVLTGKITSVQKINGTWLIWFNGQEAYCCTHGAKGTPNGCPTYTYAYTSIIGAEQLTPGDHYANQINIWGGLDQLSLGLLTAQHEGMVSAFTFSLDGESAETSQAAYTYYDDLQLWIMEHYPDSVAGQIYRQSAEQHAHNVPEGHAFKHLRNRDEHQRGACLQGVRVAAGEGKHRRDNHQTGHNRNRGVKNFDVLGGFLNRDILFHIRAEGDQNAHRDGQ